MYQTRTPRAGLTHLARATRATNDRPAFSSGRRVREAGGVWSGPARLVHC